jgi:hypothetical protein
MFWRLLPRRFCAVVALVGYVTAAIGMPLPVSFVRGGGLPFPCQSLLCGCENAAQCKTCGCFTLEQQVAWAAAHNVEPSADAPKSAESAQAVSPASKKTEQQEPAEKPCCCCRGKCADGAPMPCCQHKQPAHKPVSETPPPVVPPKSGFRVALGLGALKCQGVTTLWVSAGAVLCPEPPLAGPLSLDPSGRLKPTDLHSFADASRPLDPPPRSRCI